MYLKEVEWVCQLIKGLNLNKIHRRHTWFLKELYWQKLRLKVSETVQNKERPLELPSPTPKFFWQEAA